MTNIANRETHTCTQCNGTPMRRGGAAAIHRHGRHGFRDGLLLSPGRYEDTFISCVRALYCSLPQTHVTHLRTCVLVFYADHHTHLHRPLPQTPTNSLIPPKPPSPRNPPLSGDVPSTGRGRIPLHARPTRGPGPRHDGVDGRQPHLQGMAIDEGMWEIGFSLSFYADRLCRRERVHRLFFSSL
jgi:hypothetical protein